MASVKAALAGISSAYHGEKWPAGENAVIVIDGTITFTGTFDPDSSMVDISGANKYPPIVLKGDPANGGVLNANGTRNNQNRVLVIAGNKVTLGDKLTLTGGYSPAGGAIHVDADGEFIMAGGEISGNTAETVGGGIFVYEGRMTMTGGTIKNNSLVRSGTAITSGGGIYLNKGSFTMTNGTIVGNGGDGTVNGGGVFTGESGVFTMNGGEIRDNRAFLEGGGVYVTLNGKFKMSGGKISGNKSALAGDVFTSISNGFEKTGGTVSGNTPN
jgi:hypothetical protein